VATGSHIDAIPYSGKYDGVVGVLGAIEAINVLQRFAIFCFMLMLVSERNKINCHLKYVSI
jgi:hypothetical protein